MSLKAKFRTIFPASVFVSTPLQLVKTGLKYSFSINLFDLANQLAAYFSGRYASTIDDLKAITVGSTPSVYVAGYYTAGDGGGGWFYGDTASAAADNGGTIIAPNLGTGRWLREINDGAYNVRAFGAGPSNTAAVNNVAFENTIAAASTNNGKVYIPAGAYLGNLKVQDLSGLVIEGDGLGSAITSAGGTNALDIFSNIGSGNVNNIVVRNLKVQGTGAGSVGLRIWNAISFDIHDVYASGDIGASIQGSGFGTINNSQMYGNSAGLKVGNGAETLTNAGPLVVDNALLETAAGTGPGLVVEGNPLGVVFSGCNYQSNGGTQVASITIDGSPTGAPVGSVTFLECHGESNYNTTNTGADYLIGNAHKFGSVKIIGGNSWGHGEGDDVHYQRDFIKIVAARSVTVSGVTTSNLGHTGYSRSMIRLETTFPNVGAGDTYIFENNVYDGSGVIYSDANGRLLGNSNASFETSVINTLVLGNALTVANGGTGATTLTSHGILLGEGTGAVTPTAAMTNGQLLVGQTGADPLPKTISGDWTMSAAGAATLATVNSNVGTFGSATQSVQYTVNAKGLVTAAANVTITPAIGSITGLGTGVATALGINVGSAGAFVTFNGPLGTPSSGTGTNLTGIPISTGLTGAGTGVLAALAVNVGSAGAPVLFNGAGGTPSSITLTNGTGLPLSTGISGAGTGVLAALAINVGAAGAFVTNGGALGTPSSGVASNLTGSTAAVDTSNTNLATNAYVINQAAAATPGAVTNTAAVGTSTRYARADHVHAFENTAWTTYTPTISSTGGSLATTGTTMTAAATGRYKQIGKTIICEIDSSTISVVGTASGNMIATLPFTAAAARYAGSSFEYSVTAKSGACFINSSGTTTSTRQADGNTFWVVNQGVVFTIVYESA